LQYGLIGEQLGHSFSKEIHGRIADYEYELRELRPEELDGFMRTKDFRAVNVTIPYKQAVMPYLDEITDRAGTIGSVNTIVNKNGRLTGDNTDFAGMSVLIDKLKLNLQGRKVLILGTGGTSKTAQAVVGDRGAGEIYKVSRGGRKEEDLAVITYEEAMSTHSDAQIIINTTPVGMYPRMDECPIDVFEFPQLEGVIDAIYNPLCTNLILDARERGLPAEGGLYMLSGQGVYACGAFLDREMSKSDIDKAFREVLKEKQNIVLTGMPSCGKTTIGRLIADRYGKAFIDTDELVTEMIVEAGDSNAPFGYEIADYISRKGETSFRDLETEVVKTACREGGKVIATGGGAILRRENIRAMKQNGPVIFIDRSLEKLIATSDRPLSSSPEALRQRYIERRDIYLGSADIIVDGDGDIKTVLSRALRAIENYEY
jgi:shikimate dehydrogenase